MMESMTTVQVHFRCTTSLDEQQLLALEQLKGQLYGVRGFTEREGELMVDYDATRLTPALLETALHAAGIPVSRS